LSGKQKGTWISAVTTQLECSEILEPVSVGHIKILGFPLSQFEEIVFGNLTFLSAIAQMSPFLSGKSFPLDLGHASTAEYQGAEFIHQSILLLRVVLSKIRLQSLEELPFAILLAFQAKANECGNCLTHTRINRLGVLLDLIR
jgi:hypothetical protein